MNEIFTGANEVRQRLEGLKDTDYPLYRELRDERLTDYIAWPLDHTLGKRHVVTFSSDAPGGFTDDHVSFLRDLMPALTLVSEIRIKNILARDIAANLCRPACKRANSAGATTRGSGTTVGAAILICDLRDFTTISDMWPRDDVIELLNSYFDAMSEPIERHGGEILNSWAMGFWPSFRSATRMPAATFCCRSRKRVLAMDELNTFNAERGQVELRYGVGVHVGDVMYGNIGSRKRLDFTVIGPAVNVASRLETLTKEVGRPVLISKAFVDQAQCGAELEEASAPSRSADSASRWMCLRSPTARYFAIARNPRRPRRTAAGQAWHRGRHGGSSSRACLPRRRGPGP